MKYAVIDVGSNSVRLMISDGEKTFYKTVKTTQLAAGMGDDNRLQTFAIERTALAVYFLNEQAKKEKVDKVYAFATAAVRQAVNGDDFLSEVKRICGLEIDVVSGDREAELGLIGALNGKDGGVVDVGGASSEVIIMSNGKKVYAKSINIGAVKVKDCCGQDIISANKYIDEKTAEFGEIPKSELCAIGGTATSLAAIAQELDEYDPNKIDGYEISVEQLKDLAEKLFSMSVEERKSLKGLQEGRAEIIAGGALLLYKIAKKARVDKITVSEKDNLEGYLKVKLEKI